MPALVTPKRTKTVSFPIGLFCDATISIPPEDSPEPEPALPEMDDVFPSPIRKDLPSEVPSEEVNWNDTSA